MVTECNVARGNVRDGWRDEPKRGRAGGARAAPGRDRSRCEKAVQQQLQCRSCSGSVMCVPMLLVLVKDLPKTTEQSQGSHFLVEQFASLHDNPDKDTVIDSTHCRAATLTSLSPLSYPPRNSQYAVQSPARGFLREFTEGRKSTSSYLWRLCTI